jgi:hypothetical protein
MLLLRNTSRNSCALAEKPSSELRKFSSGSCPGGDADLAVAWVPAGNKTSVSRHEYDTGQEIVGWVSYASEPRESMKIAVGVGCCNVRTHAFACKASDTLNACCMMQIVLAKSGNLLQHVWSSPFCWFRWPRKLSAVRAGLQPAEFDVLCLVSSEIELARHCSAVLVLHRNAWHLLHLEVS